MTSSPSRRRLLQLLLASAVLPLGLIGVAWTSVPGLRRAVIGRLTGDLPGARAIGLRYLADNPGERHGGALADGLFGETRAAPAGDREMSALRRQLAARSRADFASGDTIIVDGWIVARTEARLCALTVMSS
jgi:hypothetical protein